MLVVLDQWPDQLWLCLELCSEPFRQVNHLTRKITVWHTTTREGLNTPDCCGHNLCSLR